MYTMLRGLLFGLLVVSTSAYAHPIARGYYWGAYNGPQYNTSPQHDDCDGDDDCDDGYVQQYPGYVQQNYYPQYYYQGSDSGRVRQYPRRGYYGPQNNYPRHYDRDDD